jgi:hypothetical protein
VTGQAITDEMLDAVAEALIREAERQREQASATDQSERGPG